MFLAPPERARSAHRQAVMTRNLPRQRMPIRTLGLQTRIICLVILIVACVLLLSSFLDSKLSEQAFEKDLRDQTVNLAQELAAGVAVQQIIGAPDILNKEIETFQRLRKHLLSLEVFLSGPQGPILAASTPGSSRSVPEPEVWDEIREGRVSTSMENVQEPRIWKVTAPIQVQEEIVGAIRVRSSLENARRLAARERRQSFSIMTAACVFIVAGLGLYLQHHVS